MMRWMNKYKGGDDALMWQSELKRHVSGEYSVAVVQANSCLEDQSQVMSSPHATFVGVYDGHGGPDASRFVNSHLFPAMLKFSQERGGVSSDVIRMAFKATEDEFFRVVKKHLPVNPSIASVGSCCLVGAISEQTLYVANLGDSRAVLGRKINDKRKPVVAERMSMDHNVADQDVRNELTALHPDDAHIVMYIRGVWRVKGIIQVSRSIGDVYLKKPEYNKDPYMQQLGVHIPMKRPVLSSEPSIIKRQLNPQDMFLIFASDGLWEHLTDQEAVDIVSNNPRAGVAKRLARAALQEAAKKREVNYSDLKRIERGARRNFHDDITVIVIYLDHHKVSSDKLGNTTAPVDIFSLKDGQTRQMA